MIQDVFGNQLVKTVIAGVFAFVWVGLNRLKRWGLSPPQIGVYALWFFVGTLLLFETLGLEPSVRTKVRNWLDTPAFSVRTVDHHDGFGFEVTDRQNRIFQITGTGPVITFTTGVKLSEGLKDLFLSLNKQQKDQFISDLRIELLRAGIAYQNLGDNLHEGVILSTQSAISRDTNRMEFFKTLFFIRGSRDFYIELVKKWLTQSDKMNT